MFLHSVTGKEAPAASLKAGVWKVVLPVTRVEGQHYPLQHLEPTGFPISLIPSAESLSIHLLRTILHVYFHCVSKLNRTKGYNILTALWKACLTYPKKAMPIVSLEHLQKAVNCMWWGVHLRNFAWYILLEDRKNE